MTTFVSAVLGAVSHPTNILTEYLSLFRGGKKFKAYILSWLDGWIHKKLLEGKPPWVYVVLEELAEAFGCCRDTVHRHLKELCELGILVRQPYKRWATDKIFAYTIDFEKLQQELGKASAENQNTDSRKSECRQSENRTPTVQNQDAYTNTALSSSQVQPQTAAVAEEKSVEPTDEEIAQACTEIRALSPDIQVNAQVRSAIRSFWHNVPAAIHRVKSAIAAGWCKKPTGVLVKALKFGVPPENLELEVTPREYPHPTIEQLNQLSGLGELVYTRLNEPGHPEVLAVNTGSEVIPWWDALAKVGGAA
jgi:predicted transcriptional regulator